MAGSKSESRSAKTENKPSLFANIYLFSYNFIQVFGWSYLLYQLVNHYTSGRTTDTLWNEVRLTVIIFQNAAVLEILNVAIGIVKSNLMLTTFQVFSRVMVVCGILLATPTAPLSPGLPLALLAWSVTEVIRYLYYALNIVGLVPYVLIWCRYTFFIALYPIGITGELLCMYAAQKFVGETQLWSVSLPNKYNFTFSYHYLIIYIMLLYIPLFPQLYLHMFGQRKKIIGTPQSAKAKSS
ncbi:very-long-chain (3R)-3-hydroxyacyl-CoA dehydratase hpo-8 [Macrosteles quadrilineatus]|uniref:very-long-chain (3R)-3-hydroxyacyl-CoA dehydratase hpo-8 n=1 Tax=Macrosteles quadrilineatus TaxID=74068 RepID=UPI0023E10233|nr:very-long-chain (3R)-3-hydroxyacyl-CoA dehydratase hpo-8 [Macrosteles quadrilineatus]